MMIQLPQKNFNEERTNIITKLDSVNKYNHSLVLNVQDNISYTRKLSLVILINSQFII